MDATTSPCQWIYRVWLTATLAWLAFIAWRTMAGWPMVPLDMGGADSSRDAAFQAAQLQHLARALLLCIGAPAAAFIAIKLVCRPRH